MAQTTTSVTHDDTQPLEITVPRKVPLIKFSAVGRLDTLYADNRRIEHIDIFDLMSTQTSTVNNVLKEIKDQLDYRTNEASLTKLGSAYKIKSRSESTKILKDLGVIKKIGQRSFIVSPYLIVPPANFQKDILAKWDSLP